MMRMPIDEAQHALLFPLLPRPLKSYAADVAPPRIKRKSKDHFLEPGAEFRYNPRRTAESLIVEAGSRRFSS
jgi:hypothetical protein